MWRTGATLLGICLLVFGMTAPVAAQSDEPPALYLALGNSLAYGIGATDPARLGYVPRLYHSLQGLAKVDELKNVAVPGAMSSDLFDGQQPIGQLAEALAIINQESDVRVVTLDIGGNDLLGLLFPGGPCYPSPAYDEATCYGAVATRLQTFAANYSAILSVLMGALAADPGEETVLVMTYYNHVSGAGAPYDALNDLITLSLLGGDKTLDCAVFPNPLTTGLNDMIACIGASFGATIVDVYPLFVGKGPSLTNVLENGDVHPTNAGHAVIASAFRDAYKAATR